MNYPPLKGSGVSFSVLYKKGVGFPTPSIVNNISNTSFHI